MYFNLPPGALGFWRVSGADYGLIMIILWIAIQAHEYVLDPARRNCIQNVLVRGAEAVTKNKQAGIEFG